MKLLLECAALVLGMLLGVAVLAQTNLPPVVDPATADAWAKGWIVAIGAIVAAVVGAVAWWRKSKKAP